MSRVEPLNLEQAHKFSLTVGAAVNYLWIRFLPGFIRRAQIGVPTRKDARDRILSFLLTELSAYEISAQPLGQASVEAYDLDSAAQPEYLAYYSAFMSVISDIYKFMEMYLITPEPKIRPNVERFALSWLTMTIKRIAAKGQ